MISFISKLKKLSKRVNGLHEIKRLLVSMADPSSLLCDCSKAKTARIIVSSVTKPLPN